MTIYKRGRVWYYDFWFEGERFGPKTTGCTNKREAQAYEDDLKAQARNRRLSSRSERWTVQAGLDAWLDAIRGAIADVSSYTSRVRTLKANLGDTLRLDQLTSGEVQRYVTRRLGAGIKQGTVREELAKLKTMRKWVSRNHPEVVLGAEIEWPVLKASKKIRFLADSEELALLAELDPELVRKNAPGGHILTARREAHDLCVFLLDTGARIGEASAATWDMVRWNAGTLYLTRWKTDSQSVIPIPARLMAVLRRRWDARDRSSPYIFPPLGHSERGMRQPKGELIREAMDRAGLNAPHLVRQSGTCTVHSLRHTYGTRLARAGVAPQIIMRMMGHADIKTTMIYVNLVEGDGVDEVRGVLDQLANTSPNIVQFSHRQPVDDAEVSAA